MSRNELPDQKTLHELFEYRNGKLFWKKDTKNYKKRAGDMAGYIERNTKRYCVGWEKREVLASNVIFVMFYGYLPEVIDFIDNDPLNTMIENLRAATTSQTIYNRRKPKSNTSGYKGVTWCNEKKKWAARIGKDYKNLHLGYFDDPRLAHESYCKAARELHGEFANFG
jgi:hypothetical protein